MLDEIVRKIASLGLPGVMFAVAASIAGGMGLVGGAVVTTALAMLGGPMGMVGGLAVLGLATVIADAVGKFGIETVLIAVYGERRRRGEDYYRMANEINGLWISDELKRKIKQKLRAGKSYQ